MAVTPTTKLYTPNLLSLATQLSDYPLDRPFAYHSSGRSRTCGSTVEVGVDLDATGRVANLGIQVTACAIGQSSAAILAIGAKGRTPHEIAQARSDIARWLSAPEGGQFSLPDWPGFQPLEPAREHKGRHGALLMAWTAVSEALSSSDSAR